MAEQRAALLILENTHTRAGGTTLSVELTQALAAAAKRHDCRVHLDGARLVNASVALGVPLADLAAPANSVVLSLNKSLSAPIGAVLAGSEAVVERARLMLHRLGGASVHRAGIAAAAGLVALDTMVDRIADDHRRARELGGLLAAIPGDLESGRRRSRRTSCWPTSTETGIDAARLVDAPRGSGRARDGTRLEADSPRHAPARSATRRSSRRRRSWPTSSSVTPSRRPRSRRSTVSTSTSPGRRADRQPSGRSDPTLKASPSATAAASIVSSRHPGA